MLLLVLPRVNLCSLCTGAWVIRQYKCHETDIYIFTMHKLCPLLKLATSRLALSSMSFKTNKVSPFHVNVEFHLWQSLGQTCKENLWRLIILYCWLVALLVWSSDMVGLEVVYYIVRSYTTLYDTVPAEWLKCCSEVVIFKMLVFNLYGV